jgi:maleylacetoacetate isomerase
MQLYDYFRSSAAYRVRIAMNLKGIAYEQVPVSLQKGEHRQADYLSINPQGAVPSLRLPDGSVLTQSLAICEYLEETHPEPPLLPGDALARARVRSLANIVTCDIHPLNNSRVLTYLVRDLQLDDDTKLAWYRHWIERGLGDLEKMLVAAPQTGTYCHGERPTLADVCLMPQLFNARRFDCPLADYPTVLRIEQACAGLPAFSAAHPDRQPDSAS